MRLGINIDHVATLRQARLGRDPEPVFAALLAEASGADALVAHLREDRRHINDKDIYLLKSIIKIRFNLEMSMAPEIVKIAAKLQPDQATLVPEKREELTTEGGLDVLTQGNKVKKIVQRLADAGVAVSLFIEPLKEQIKAAQESGAKMVELHTGAYANAKSKAEEERFFKQLKMAVDFARALELSVFAGHGLNYNNVSRIASLRGIEELNIGHAIISRAVFVGLGRAIKEMKGLIG